jgi:hypothetical protein
MQATFRRLGGVGQDELTDGDVAFMRRFGPAVTFLVEEFQRLDGSFTRQLPFSTKCAAIKEVGRKAQAITQEMRQARGIAQLPETPVESPFNPGPGGFDLGGNFSTLVWLVGGAAAAAIVLPAVLRARR